MIIKIIKTLMIYRAKLLIIKLIAYLLIRNFKTDWIKHIKVLLQKEKLFLKKKFKKAIKKP